jgi:hypothetical protein
MSKQSYKNNKSKATHSHNIEIHPQAIYYSRLLDFKNLPEPKNADNNTTKINASKLEKTSHKPVNELKSGGK